MATQKQFSVNPSVSITRSKFRRPSQHKTTLNLGEITPIYLEQDVLPGSTYKINLSSLVRMSTPIRPIMDNIHIDYFAFFIPNRLVWTHWKEFMGENTSSAGIYSGTEYTLPHIQLDAEGVSEGSLGDHLGLPLVDVVDGITGVTVSALPGRAYYLIYNEFFRDQNIIAPIPVSIGDNDGISGLVNDADYNSLLLKAAKDSDYFTRALPYAQKGAPVYLPLSGNAPVIIGEPHMMDKTSEKGLLLGTTLKESLGINFIVGHDGAFVNKTRSGPDSTTLSDGIGTDSSYTGTPDYVGIHASNMVADLSTATASTINELRFAFQYQKMLEKDAMYGTRYWEVIKGHFGVEAPDASLQRPQLLGSFRQHINIDQLAQTNGYNDTPSSNALGELGAVSVTGSSNKNIVTFSATEHGMIMILAVARHDQTYGQGVGRGWSRKVRTDYYFPVFANLGAQDIKNKELFLAVGGASSANDKVFGYQEAWAEYRYKPSICTGGLRRSLANALAPWTLSNVFTSTPTLGQVFIEQDRDSLSNALVTGVNGPDFIADFFFDEICVQPMPMYSVPGLIDHH